MANAAVNSRESGSIPKPRLNPDAATIADVRDDISVLRSDVAETVSDLTEAGLEAAKFAAHKVAGHAKTAQDAMGQAINARPVVAILVAFGVGAVVARLLMSKR